MDTQSSQLARPRPDAAPPPAPEPPQERTRSVRRRGAVACRRCRRYRTKCIHETSEPPCEACQQAGPEAAFECYFPRRGEKDSDRHFRRRPVVAKDQTSAGPVSSSPDTSIGNAHTDRPHSKQHSDVCGTGPGNGTRITFGMIDGKLDRVLAAPSPGDLGDVMPPHDEIIEGCRIFVTSYFQLGFFPRTIFLENLTQHPAATNKFLLTCILSISARFSPKLIRRYGSAANATNYFLDLSKCMVPTEMYRPSLDSTQAFFLLAISQWGNGDRDASQMDMGVAVRMAAMLKLHREETYDVGQNAPADQVVRSESARRTFWMIQSQENLHSGYRSPMPFALQDITALLPSNESDFAFGVNPRERAALAGTPPAIEQPQLVLSPQRCLFATLIQAHSLWGRVARGASRQSRGLGNSQPWCPDSPYQKTIRDLSELERSLPEKQTFSVWNLRGWKSESLHLAYLSVTMVIRLSNIVTRRVYMDDMLSALHAKEDSRSEMPPGVEIGPELVAHGTSATTKLPGARALLTQAPKDFWKKTSRDLFENVSSLYEQIGAFIATRGDGEGFPQILVFCVYMCGSLASYLWEHPSLCPELSQKAEDMAQKSLSVLSDLQSAWPTSSQWQRGLQHIATPLTGQNDNVDHKTAGSKPSPRPSGGCPSSGMQDNPSNDQRQGLPSEVLEELFNTFLNGNGTLAETGTAPLAVLSNELLDAEFAAFMHGDSDTDMLNGWNSATWY